MKILYICGDQGIPVFGRKGASTHIREMIRAFRQLGHEVVLAASDLTGDRQEGESYPCFQLPRYQSKLLGLDGRYITGNFRAKKVLNKICLEFKPDFVYERSALFFTAGESISAKYGIPRIFEINALLSKEQENRLHFPKLAYRCEMKLAQHAKAIASISQVMKEELVSLGCSPDVIRPFPMAVDPQRFICPANPLEKRQDLGWDEKMIVFGYLGSMNNYHKPEWFIDLAEKYLAQGNQQCRFLIVGGAPLKVDKHRSRLKRWVDQGKVHFTGTVPQEEMPKWISSMNAVLVPGAAPQSTPTKIFEAAAVGTPLILPATKPIKAIFGPDFFNLFDPNNFTAFEEAVQEFLQNQEKHIKLSAKVKSHVTENYTWLSHARKIVGWAQEFTSQLKKA